MFCQHCYKSIPLRDKLCRICQLLLASIVLPPRSHEEIFHGLFSYEEILRTMILRAKVKNDFIALRFLRDLVLNHVHVPHLVRWSHVIMPAPSSLWGRVRGRFDVAGYIAEELACEYAKLLKYPPLQLSFRWKKRAMEKKSTKVSLPKQIVGSKPRLLLIDDVATTGFTVAHLMHELKGYQIKVLTIASANRAIENM